MENFAVPATMLVVLGFVAFALWLRQQRRMMIHRERLAAIEKGLEPTPVVEKEAVRINFNVQRLLLLAGLIWISVGIGFYLVFSAVVAHPIEATKDVPPGLQYAGIGMIGVGISHLIAFAAGRGSRD